MLSEAVFEVGCYAGVVFVVFFDYVEMPHIVYLSRTSLASLGTSSHRFSTLGEVQGDISPLNLPE